MRRIIIALASLAIMLVSAGLHVRQAAAIETSGIGALPAHPRLSDPRTKSIFVYEIAGDDVVTDGIKVVNNTDGLKTLAVYPVDSQASSDGAFACAQKVDPKTEVGSWIKLAQSQVTLPANTSQIVPFTLTVPGDVKGGEHNGCIVVQDADPPTKEEGNGIVLSFRSALRVAVTTPGALRADLSFVDVKVRDISRKLIGISPILQNKGNISANPNIHVKLTGILGWHYPFASISGQFPVFAGRQSRFNFEVKKPFWGGWYNRDVQASYKKPLPSGELSDNVTTIESKSATIFIAPQPKALAIEIIAALVLETIIFYVIRRLWLFHRLRSRSTKNYTVLEGETVDSVARKFNIKWRELAIINHLKSPYTLHAGQVIKVPAAHSELSPPKAGPSTPAQPGQGPPPDDNPHIIKPEQTQPPDTS